MRAANRYRQTQATTASPEEVLLLLYDGAVRFAEESLEHFEAGRFGPGGERIGRVMAIVAEFQSSLDHAKAPELCATLDGLYSFMTQQLLKANRHQDKAALGEVIELLRSLRATWAEAAERARREQAEKEAEASGSRAFSHQA